MNGENISLVPNPSTGASHGSWFEPEVVPMTPEAVLWIAVALLCVSIGILILLIIAKEKNSFLRGFQSKFRVVRNQCVFVKKPEFEWNGRNRLIALMVVVFVAASGFLIYECLKSMPYITAASAFALIIAFASLAVSIKRYY